MGPEIIAAFIGALAFAIGITGIIVPVLPGSITIIIGTLIWAIIVGGWGAWIPFVIIAILCGAGMTSSYVLAGRQLKQQETPSWAILVAVLGGIVGFFLFPGPGVIIGFILALFLTEYSRRKDVHDALRHTGSALKALGIGILIEVSLATVAALVFIVAAAYAIFAC